MHDLLNLHPLEPQGIRANVPPSHGPVQPGHALDFLPAAAHLHKAQSSRAGNRAGQGYMARQAILTRTAKEWGGEVMFKFWPFPVLRNYSTAPSLSRLFLEFASAPDLQISENDYCNVTVVCSKGTLRFWDSNRFYAWASSGSLTANGRTVHWRDEMPSRYAVRAMHQALDRVRFAVPSTEKEAA